MKNWLCLFPLLLPVLLPAQDAHFTQYNSTPVYLNPGFAGSWGCSRASAAYRMQWTGISGSYNSLLVSYDQYVPKLKGGLALVYLNDRAGSGLVKTNMAELVYAGHIKLGGDNESTGKVVLKPALSVGIGTKSVDWSALSFGDMIDPRRGYSTSPVSPDRETAVYPDFAAGVLAYSKNIFGGIAVRHLLEPNQSLFDDFGAPLPRKYTAHLGGIIRFGNPDPDALQLTPHIMVMKQYYSEMLLGGISAGWKKMFLGLSYRTGDAFGASLGYRNNLFSAGYSYDYTISRLTNATAGSHELTTAFRFGCKNKRELIRTLELAPGI